jgi:hypothetical protein
VHKPFASPAAGPATPVGASAPSGARRLIPGESDPVTGPAAATGQAGMFDTFTPKRRRFSFFWN